MEVTYDALKKRLAQAQEQIAVKDQRIAELEAALATAWRKGDGIMSDYHEGLEEGIKIGMEEAAKIAHEIAERGHITFNIAAAIRAAQTGGGR